jgi:hypothetical protein
MNYPHLDMPLDLTYNDVWGSIPFDAVDDILDFFSRNLQPTHPLRSLELFPVAKLSRRYKYLLEGEKPNYDLWLLDLEKKKRYRGRTCYYFKRIETQEELDALLRADYEEWVQLMKDAGAWNTD